MRRLPLLIASLLAAGLYCGALIALGGVTGGRVVDGSLGIVLGLYTASHPAAFAIDLFYASRSEAQPGADTSFTWPNFALQATALALAWMALTLGAIHLGGR